MPVPGLLVPGDPPPFPRQSGGSSVRLRRRRDQAPGVPGRRKQDRHSGDFTGGQRAEDWAWGAGPGAQAGLQQGRAVSASVANLREPAGPRGHRQSGDFSQARGQAPGLCRARGQEERQCRGQEERQCRGQEERQCRGQEERQCRGQEERQSRVQEERQCRGQEERQCRSQEERQCRSQEERQPRQPRSQSQQQRTPVSPASPPPALQGRERGREGNTKPCSGEFEFQPADRRSRDVGRLSRVLAGEQGLLESLGGELARGPGDTGSDGSEESGVFSTGSSQESPRRPGLGRRAVTQLDVRDRKASYNSALARSQENLVKAPSGSPALHTPPPDPTALRKGLLWQQKDKLFSRWKERYFILTRDLLQCFKKSTSKITEMGEFIFKIKLSEVEGIELLDKRGYLTICLALQREGKVYLRRTEGIRDWHGALREATQESRARRANRASAVFLDRRQNTDSAGMEQWAVQRRLSRNLSDSTPDVHRGVEKERITLDELSRLYRDEEEEEIRKQEVDTKINRLSMLSTTELPDHDSGNNSLQSSSTGTGSSKLSQPIESSFAEEDEEDYAEDPKPSPELRVKKPTMNTNIIEVRYRERRSVDRGSVPPPSHQPRPRSQHVNRLQITHV